VSHANVEFIRRFGERLTALFQRGGDVRAFVEEFWDEHCDYYPAAKWRLDFGETHGREAMIRFHHRYLEAWDEVAFEPQQLIAIGDHRVLGHFRIDAHGRDSRLGVSGDLYQCFWLRSGRIMRAEDHLTLEGALRGFGLRGSTLEEAGLPTAGSA
jgi:hypothetical protein